MNKNFLKVGENVTFKPSLDGMEYDLEGGSVYRITYDRFRGNIILKTTTALTLPPKVYNTEKDENFISRVVNRYNEMQFGVLGVMLAGLKGSGKTVTLKQIALASHLPILILDNEFPMYKLKYLFDGLAETEACLIFDELDKQCESDNADLLQVLDGINTTGKKLILFACNKENKIGEFLKDRCSRIRYWKNFDKMSKELIQKVVSDRVENKEDADKITEFIYNNFKCISFDNILSFVDEANQFTNVPLDELFTDMNLTKK